MLCACSRLLPSQLLGTYALPDPRFHIDEDAPIEPFVSGDDSLHHGVIATNDEDVSNFVKDTFDVHPTGSENQKFPRSSFPNQEADWMKFVFEHVAKKNPKVMAAVNASLAKKEEELMKAIAAATHGKNSSKADVHALSSQLAQIRRKRTVVAAAMNRGEAK